MKTITRWVVIHSNGTSKIVNYKTTPAEWSGGEGVLCRVIQIDVDFPSENPPDLRYETTEVK